MVGLLDLARGVATAMDDERRIAADEPRAGYESLQLGLTRDPRHCRLLLPHARPLLMVSRCSGAGATPEKRDDAALRGRQKMPIQLPPARVRLIVDGVVGRI